ncbi:MAG: hypothetical protein GXP55_04125, partial [Deltaproteobacteria bacterium]|nr:hypothetical protein [Deltaproteobacteria bacterium]
MSARTPSPQRPAWWRRAALWAVALGGLMLAGCGSPLTGSSCASGFTRCADQCVDLSADPAHCGSCESRCTGGDVCGGGSCVPADA